MFILYPVIEPVFRTVLNKLVIKELLLQIGLLDTDTHRVSEVIYDLRSSSDEPVMVCIKLEEVALDVSERNHSFDHSRLNLYIHTPFGKA